MRLFPQFFLCLRRASLKCPELDESDESNKEKSNELGSESGSFGTCGDCLGGFLSDVLFVVGGNPIDYDWPFNGGGGSFCSVIWYVYCRLCT